MARKDKQLPQEPSEGFDLDGMYSGEQLSPALAAVYSELGIEAEGQINMYVSKLLPDGRESRIWDGSPSEYDLTGLSKRFGSGDYRVKLYAPLPASAATPGKIVMRGKRDFSITLEPGEDAAIEAKRNSQQFGMMPAASTMTPEAIAKIVAESIRASMPPQPDAFAMVAKLAETMKSLMPAPVAPLPVVAPISPMESFFASMKMVQGFIEASRALNPAVPVDGEGNPNLMGMALTRGLNMFADALEKKAAAPGSPPTGANGTEHHQAVIGQEAGTLSAEDQEMLQMWRLQLKAANRSAQAAIPAADFAETVFPMVPDTVIEGMALDPAWFKLLCDNVPECAQHEVWYTQVRAKLIDLAVEDGLLTRDEKGNIIAGDDTDRTPGAAA